MLATGEKESSCDLYYTEKPAKLQNVSNTSFPMICHLLFGITWNNDLNKSNKWKRNQWF